MRQLVQKEIQQAWKFLETDRDNLLESGHILSNIILEGKETGRIVISIDPSMSDEDRNEFLSVQLPASVREWNAHTVYIIDDGWTTNIPDGNPQLYELVKAVGAEAAANAGYTERCEALSCRVVTPRRGTWLLLWEYKRDENNQPVMGERKVHRIDDIWHIFGER